MGKLDDEAPASAATKAPPSAYLYRWVARLDSWLALPFIGLIRLYQLSLSAWVGRQCRFYPSCSHYGLEALKRHGAARGLWLTGHRLLRCQPLCHGGLDPVPETKPSATR